MRFRALNSGASTENFVLRVEDIPAVINQLESWNKETNHPLYSRLDLTSIGMSGHSFGALTTQAVSGQKTLRGDRSFTDPRIKAAILFSPSSPRRGTPQQAFGSVKIPWLLMTGTKDVSSIGGIDLESRLAVFPALAPGNKYEVVLYGAQHSAFTDRSLPGETEARNPNHHRVIKGLSTAFWDSYLRNDSTAKNWLDGQGVLSLFEGKDRWQKK